MTFAFDDAVGVKFPHTDTLFITVSIADVEIWRVLANGGFFADLLFMRAFD